MSIFIFLLQDEYPLKCQMRHGSTTSNLCRWAGEAWPRPRRLTHPRRCPQFRYPVSRRESADGEKLEKACE